MRQVNPGNAKLFNNVGHALEGTGRHEAALEYFYRAVRVQPDDIGAHINIGRTLGHLGRDSQVGETGRLNISKVNHNVVEKVLITCKFCN